MTLSNINLILCGRVHCTGKEFINKGTCIQLYLSTSIVICLFQFSFFNFLQIIDKVDIYLKFCSARKSNSIYLCILTFKLEKPTKCWYIWYPSPPLHGWKYGVKLYPINQSINQSSPFYDLNAKKKKQNLTKNKREREREKERERGVAVDYFF